MTIPPPYLRHNAWSGILQRLLCFSSCLELLCRVHCKEAFGKCWTGHLLSFDWCNFWKLIF